MKKILCALILVFGFTGCGLAEDMDNTPTKKVEAFLNKYQSLDTAVIEDLDDIVEEEETFSTDQKKLYKDIIKSNYQKLKYVVKEEEVDGNEAKVTVEIEVVDYSKIVSESNEYLRDNPTEFLTNEKYDESLFIDYKLSKLKDAKEKIKYTLEFTLSKANDEWVLDSITEEIRNKINGNY